MDIELSPAEQSAGDFCFYSADESRAMTASLAGTFGYFFLDKVSIL